MWLDIAGSLPTTLMQEQFNATAVDLILLYFT
jgi:hypothetical protein